MCNPSSPLLLFQRQTFLLTTCPFLPHLLQECILIHHHAHLFLSGSLPQVSHTHTRLSQTSYLHEVSYFCILLQPPTSWKSVYALCFHFNFHLLLTNLHLTNMVSPSKSSMTKSYNVCPFRK